MKYVNYPGICLFMLVTTIACKKDKEKPADPTGDLHIKAGYYHSLIIRKDNSLWGIGSYASGELGTPIGSISRRTPYTGD